MTRTPRDSQRLLQERRQAPPVGRALRILLGLMLIVYVGPVYFRVRVSIVIGTLVVLLGLIGVYSLIHVAMSRRILAFGTCSGACAGLGILVAVYLAGAPGSLILGHGEGQLAAVTFLGISLVIAGARAVPGCEVMAIPSVLSGKQSELACLVFSPLDKLERRLRSNR